MIVTCAGRKVFLDIREYCISLLERSLRYIKPCLRIRDILLVILGKLRQIRIKTKSTYGNDRILRRARYNLPCGDLGVEPVFIELVDIYEDASLGNRKSITVRYSLGAYDHTLSGEEIENFRAELIGHASKNNIILR